MAGIPAALRVMSYGLWAMGWDLWVMGCHNGDVVVVDIQYYRGNHSGFVLITRGLSGF